MEIIYKWLIGIGIFLLTIIVWEVIYIKGCKEKVCKLENWYVWKWYSLVMTIVIGLILYLIILIILSIINNFSLFLIWCFWFIVISIILFIIYHILKWFFAKNKKIAEKYTDNEGDNYLF